MNPHQSFKKCSILAPFIIKQFQTSLELIRNANLGFTLHHHYIEGLSYVHKPMVTFSETSRKC